MAASRAAVVAFGFAKTTGLAVDNLGSAPESDVSCGNNSPRTTASSREFGLRGLLVIVVLATLSLGASLRALLCVRAAFRGPGAACAIDVISHGAR